MSFSSKIKNEILNNTTNKECCKICIRYGELATEDRNLNMSTVKSVINSRTCCEKAFLKGVFLGSGCITLPTEDSKSKYHFEVNVKLKKVAGIIQDILNKYGVIAKIEENKNSYRIYSKNSEDISRIISILSANTSLIEYENLRVIKSVKNDINRSINCETANQAKLITTAYKQIEAIKYLKRKGILENLKDTLKTAAILRLKNPELNIESLANIANISKSGMYHRLNKLVEIAASQKVDANEKQ